MIHSKPSKEASATYRQDEFRCLQVGVMYKDGVFTDLTGPAGSIQAVAYGINDAGVVVGEYEDSATIAHGFIWNGTTYTTLDAPNASFTLGYAINNKNQITIQWGDATFAVHASIYQNGNYKEASVPGATNTYIHGINLRGLCVYSFTDSAGAFHGSLLANGQFYQMDDPSGSDGTFSDGITDTNTIVGTYHPNSTTSGAFKAAPVL